MRIFVCSRYRSASPGIMQDNVRKTIAICRALVLAGHTPIAPHLYLNRFLNDANPSERALGIHLGQQAMQMCHEMCVADGGRSEGMTADLVAAEAFGLRVQHVSDWISTFKLAGAAGAVPLGVLIEAGLAKEPAWEDS